MRTPEYPKKAAESAITFSRRHLASCPRLPTPGPVSPKMRITAQPHSNEYSASAMRACTPPWCSPSHATIASSTLATVRCWNRTSSRTAGEATSAISTSAVVRRDTGTSTTSVVGSAFSASSTTEAEKMVAAATTLPSATSSFWDLRTLASASASFSTTSAGSPTGSRGDAVRDANEGGGPCCMLCMRPLHLSQNNATVIVREGRGLF